MNYTNLNRITSKIQQGRQRSGANLYFGRYVQVLKTYFDTRNLYARSFPWWTVQTTVINQNNNLITFLHIFLLRNVIKMKCFANFTRLLADKINSQKFFKKWR